MSKIFKWLMLMSDMDFSNLEVNTEKRYSDRTVLVCKDGCSKDEKKWTKKFDTKEEGCDVQTILDYSVNKALAIIKRIEKLLAERKHAAIAVEQGADSVEDTEESIEQMIEKHMNQFFDERETLEHVAKDYIECVCD